MSESLDSGVREVRELCADLLASAPLAAVAAAVRARGVDAARLAATIDVRPESHGRVRALKEALSDAPLEARGGQAPLERVLLLSAGLQNVAAVPGLPVLDEVRTAMLHSYRRLAQPEPALADKLTVGHPTFTSACKMLTLRRFAAGDFDWEVSGLPRSLLLRIERRRLPRFLWTLGVHVHGFRPLFVTHMAILRSGHLTSDGVQQTYWRIAKSMAMQPEIRGLLSIGWMRSPNLARVSPRLAFLASLPADNGGFVADAGKADPDCGALSRSATRRRLYEEGRYTPMTGVAIWPRSALLSWADRYDADRTR